MQYLILLPQAVVSNYFQNTYGSFFLFEKRPYIVLFFTQIYVQSLHRFRTLDISILEHRQKLIDSFVNAIYLYDDKIVLTFNYYREGSETITLGNVEGSDLTASGAPYTQIIRTLYRLTMGSDLLF